MCNNKGIYLLVLKQESESKEAKSWTPHLCFPINCVPKGQTAEQECVRPSLCWLAASRTKRCRACSVDTKCPHFHFKWWWFFSLQSYLPFIFFSQNWRSTAASSLAGNTNSFRGGWRKESMLKSHHSSPLWGLGFPWFPSCSVLFGNDTNYKPHFAHCKMCTTVEISQPHCIKLENVYQCS